MNQVREIFYPTKKKLIAFGLVVLSSLFIIQGIIQTDIITFDEEWSWWQNLLMMVFSLSNFFGSFFQASYFFLAQFINPTGEGKIIDVLGIIINSYLIGCLIGLIWEEKKSRKQKQLLAIYAGIWILFIIGIFLTFFSATLWSFGVFILTIVGAGAIIRLLKKENFKSIYLILLTLVFLAGTWYLSVHNFEDAYCWDRTSPENFNTHMGCHDNFNLLKAISETLGN